jgi:hypothetical protein
MCIVRSPSHSVPKSHQLIFDLQPIEVSFTIQNIAGDKPEDAWYGKLDLAVHKMLYRLPKSSRGR